MQVVMNVAHLANEPLIAIVDHGKRPRDYQGERPVLDFETAQLLDLLLAEGFVLRGLRWSSSRSKYCCCYFCCYYYNYFYTRGTTTSCYYSTLLTINY